MSQNGSGMRRFLPLRVGTASLTLRMQGEGHQYRSLDESLNFGIHIQILAEVGLG